MKTVNLKDEFLACLIENVLIFQEEAFNIPLAVSQSSSAAWHADRLGDKWDKRIIYWNTVHKYNYISEMIGSWTIQKATIVGYLLEKACREDWLLYLYLAKEEENLSFFSSQVYCIKYNIQC